MATTIAASDLKHGDVLLYHRTGFVPDLIRLFDGSTYSHASIYDGTKVMEAIATGIESRTIVESIQSAKFVDVYRFISTPGREQLDGPNYPAQPVLDRITFYLANRQRYAYEQILLLAMIASTRRIPVVSWIPGLNLIIRTILDHAAGVLADLIAGDKTPVICSELVYRCYGEATSGKYALAIRGADVLVPTIAAEFASVGVASGAHMMTSVVSAAEDPLLAEKAAFLAMYAAAKGVPSGALVAAASGGAGMGVAAVPDFVTPRDLSRTPNLFFVGTLQ